jgi:hypothetical protein
VPDMLLDGCFDPAADNADGKLSNCFSDNGAATFINFDLCNGFMMQSTDLTPVTCEHTPLDGADVRATMRAAGLPGGCWRGRLAAPVLLMPGCVEATTTVRRADALSGASGDVAAGEAERVRLLQGPLVDLKPKDGVVPYQVAAPLWSDQAGQAPLHRAAGGRQDRVQGG